MDHPTNYLSSVGKDNNTEALIFLPEATGSVVKHFRELFYHLLVPLKALDKREVTGL